MYKQKRQLLIAIARWVKYTVQRIYERSLIIVLLYAEASTPSLNMYEFSISISMMYRVEHNIYIVHVSASFQKWMAKITPIWLTSNE